MDTYDIIKQLTAKTDMVSGESLKDNFKALLPVVAVHQGWATENNWKFDFNPDYDYPHKEAYELETDVFNEDERVANVEVINKDIDEYNDWVEEKNVIHRKEVFEKTIPDTMAYSTLELHIESKEYFPLPHLSAWVSAFQFAQPTTRKAKHLIEFGYVDDKELYKLKESTKEELFVKKFNKQLFNYVQASIKMAEKYKTWGENNLWFNPNIEIVHWFEVNGINPDDVASFDNDIIDLTYDEKCEEAFGIEDWDKSLVQIVQEMRQVIRDNEDLFKVSGEIQWRKGYKIGCRYWTQHGKPITVTQMERASTRYPKLP